MLPAPCHSDILERPCETLIVIMMANRKGYVSGNQKNRVRQPISTIVNAFPQPRLYRKSDKAHKNATALKRTEVLACPQGSVSDRPVGLSGSSSHSEDCKNDAKEQQQRQFKKPMDSSNGNPLPQKTRRRGGWSTLGLTFWLIRQFSPGILMLSCFFIYQNTRRAAILSEALRLAMKVGERQPSALINSKRSDFTTRLGSKVPVALRNLADLSVPFNPKTETPYFWDIHFAGETIAESIFSKCHFLIQACEQGLKQPDFKEYQLEVFEHRNGAVYVNVDTSTELGIERAAKLNLAESHLANVMISPHLHLFVSSVFTSKSKGRFFALFRNPIRRAISVYRYLQVASWDPMYNPSLRDMTIEEYAVSSAVENNWMTRFLVGKPGGALRQRDIIVAKEILRTKCLVGLFEELDDSMARFQVYFGWNQSPAQSQQCRQAVLERGDERHEEVPIHSESTAWSALAAANMYDLELYEYARELYVLQGEQIFGIAQEEE